MRRTASPRGEEHAVEVEPDHDVRPAPGRRAPRPEVEQQPARQRGAAPGPRGESFHVVAPRLEGSAQDRDPDEGAAAAAHTEQSAGDEEEPRHARWYTPAVLDIEEIRAYSRRSCPGTKERPPHETIFPSGCARPPLAARRIGARLRNRTCRARPFRPAPAVGIDVSFDLLRRARRRGRASGVFSRPTSGHPFQSRVSTDHRAERSPLSSDRHANRRRALRAAQSSSRPTAASSSTRSSSAAEQKSLREMSPDRNGDFASAKTGVRPKAPLESDLQIPEVRRADLRRNRSLLPGALVGPAEIRPFFASCGLDVEKVWGDFRRRPFGFRSSRLIVVAR